MTEIKRTRTIEEVAGYQAYDGKFFKDKEECEKYEHTAEMVIYNDFKRLMVGGDTFVECCIFENFGYGSDEIEYAVIDIKNEDDLHIANMFGQFYQKGTLSPDYIGKRILVTVGNYCDRMYSWNARTEEELVEDFKNDIAKFFHPKTKEEKVNEV